MALTTITLRPNSSPQLGSWSVVGAATAWQAVSDGSNSSYVQLPSGIVRLDSQVLRFGFSAPSIPIGAQVYSVGLRRTVQTVVPPPPPPAPAPAPAPVPLCYHWFRCLTGTILVSGQELDVSKTFFSSPLPTSTTVATWTTESVFTATTAPDGQAWNATTNLANFSYDMGRGDTDSAAQILVSEVYLDITYQQQSTVTVTAPTGTTPHNRDTVRWTYFSPDSLPQQGYRVALYTLAQTQAAGFTPFVSTSIDGTNGFVLGEAQQWAMNIDLTNGQYVAWVQVESQWAGSGEFLSTAGSTTWTRSATGPPATAVLSSATYDLTNNRIGLTFAPGSSTPPTTSFTVYASRDGGQSWNPIPSLTYVPAQGMTPITGYDYVAPLGVASQYEVIAYGGTPLQAAVSPSNILSATPVDTRSWLKNPLNPLLNTVLPIAAPKQSDTGIKITMRRMQGTFQLLGGSGSEVLPFIVSGPTYGEEYELELIFVDGDPNTPMTLWAVVDELCRSGSTLLFQRSDGDQHWVAVGPGASGKDIEENFNVIPGDPTTVYWRRRKIVLTETGTPSFY